MAKNIMLSNEAYEKLKFRKELENPDKSYSDVVLNLLENKNRKKTLLGLKKYFGVLKGDKEYGEVKKKLKEGWARLTKRYA